MKRILPFLLVLVMLFAAPAAQAAEAPAEVDPSEVITLVFSFTDPETNNQYTDIFKPYFDMITERTGGRVQFECHFNGELASMMEAYDAAAKGTVDIAYVRTGSLSYCPFESLIENPPIAGSKCLRASYAMNQLFTEFPELADSYPGVHFLLRYVMYDGYIGTTKDPIEKFEDFKGKTLIIGSVLAANRAKAFGATPLDVLPPDFYTSLEKGLADGAITVTQPEMITYSWSDVIKNVTTVPVIKACCGLAMNEDVWNSLPADIQDIINEAMAEAIDLADSAGLKLETDAIETLTAEYGVNYVEPSDDLIAAMQAADEECIADFIAQLEASSVPNAGEIYARYLELYNEYSE